MIETYVKQLNEDTNLFITGAAGVGKSYTANSIIKSFQLENKQVVKLASTAMAATHISGQTLHSFFNLYLFKSIAELEKSTHFKIKKKLKKILNKTDLIVIDEISMVPAGVLDLVYLRLEQAGYLKALMVVGDFLQLAPVVNYKETVKYCQKYKIDKFNKVYGFAFACTSWEKFNFKIINLNKVYRTKDHDFMLLLDDIRKGICQAPHEHYLTELFKPTLKDSKEYTYLFATNDKTNIHNKKILSQLSSEEKSLSATFVGEEKSNDEIDKFCRDIKINRHILLKEGADILFTKNSWNYYNGQRGSVKSIDLDKGLLIIEKEDKTYIKIERERFEKKAFEIKKIKGVEQLVEVVHFTILQFPVTLAYAITIHKAQGMSIENLVINTLHIFAPSQFYVALSRAITPKRLILQGEPEKIKSLIYVNKEALKFYQLLGII